MKKLKFIFIILSVILTICLLCACTKNNNSQNSNVDPETALYINNVPISKVEVYTYLYETYNNFVAIGGDDIWETDFDGSSAEDVAKESVLNSITMVELSRQKAEELDVSLSDEQLKQSNSDASDFFSSISEDVKQKTGISIDVVEKVMKDRSLYAEVFAEITNEYVASEADFQSYFATVKEDYENYYTIMNVKSIYTNSQEDATAAYNELSQGTDFNEVFEKYNDMNINSTGNTVSSAYKGDMESQFMTEFNTQEGSVNEPFEYNGGYIVIFTESSQKTDEQSIMDMCNSDYEILMKQKLFNQEYEKWKQSAEIEKVDEVWNTIEIKGLFN